MSEKLITNRIVVDGKGYLIEDSTTKGNLEKEISRAETEEGKIKESIKSIKAKTESNTTKLSTLTGKGEGSIQEQIDKSISKQAIINPEVFETIQKIGEWMENDESGTTALIERVDGLEDRIDECGTVRFDRFEENEAIINTGEIGATPSAIVYYKPENKFVAADSAGNYWYTWDGMEVYMSDGAVRKDKVYLCGGNTYISHNDAIAVEKNISELQTLNFSKDIVFDKYLAYDGSEKAFSGNFLSPYIDVKNCNIVRWYAPTSFDGRNFCIALYDSEKTFMRAFAQSQSGMRPLCRNVRLQENEVFARITVKGDDAELQCLTDDAGNVLWKYSHITPNLGDTANVSGLLHLRNGSRGNYMNPNVVCSDLSIPVVGGEAAKIINLRPNKEGYYYRYGITFYNTVYPTSTIPADTVIKEYEYSQGHIGEERFLIPLEAKSIVVTVSEYSDENGYNPLRKEDFATFAIWVELLFDGEIKQNAELAANKVSLLENEVSLLENDISVLEKEVFGNDIPTRMRNGSQGNAANANVITIYGAENWAIPVTPGRTYRLSTTRPNREGCKYYYNIQTFSTSSPPNLYTNVVRGVKNYTQTNVSEVLPTIDTLIGIRDNEYGLSIQLLEYSKGSELKTTPLRVTDFNGYGVSLYDVTEKLENMAGSAALIDKVTNLENTISAVNSKISSINDIVLNPNITVEIGTFNDSTGAFVENPARARCAAFPVRQILGAKMKNYPGIRTWIQRLDTDKKLKGTTGTMWDSATGEINVRDLKGSPAFINFVFKREDSGSITESDLVNLKNWVIDLLYSNGNNNVAGDTTVAPIYERNIDKVSHLAAMCRYRKSSTAPSKDFQVLICTDSHGEKQPTMNSIDALNSFSTLDAWIHCGDILGGHYEPTGIQTFADCVIKAKKPFFAVLGNHDVGNTPYVAASATHEQAYAAFIKPSVDAGWLKAGEYTEGKPYWYHDDATYKIRLIGLYEYDDPMDFNTTYWKPIPYEAGLPEIKNNTTFEVGEKANPTVWGYGSGYFKYTAYSFECVKACSISGTTFHNAITYLPKYKIQRGTRVIRQEQAQWFLDTLASTPADYGVIIAMHNPFSDAATAIQSKFSQTAGVKASEFSQNSMQTDFIRNAVVAFIKGVNYSEEVVMKGSAAYLNTISSGDGGDYAYKVEKDFRTKNSNVNFLGFVGGHIHRDFVWKDASENIYQISPCCATTEIANSTGCDIRRTSEDGPAKDSLTAVSFTSKRIALAKIGVNVTENGTARDYEVIKSNA